MQRCVATIEADGSHAPEIFGAFTDGPAWQTEILNGVEHANFFETRATKYFKAATQGLWQSNEDVWAMCGIRLTTLSERVTSSRLQYK